MFSKKFDFDSVTTENTTVESNEEEKKGFSGLFKKILKEPDETEEELKDNTLEEILKYRQETKRENVAATPVVEMRLADNNKTYENTIKTINDSVVDKKIELGNAIISSDTKEIDVGVVNDFMKDATTILMSTKMDEKQVTQIIDTAEVRNEALDSTQIIDLRKEMLAQDTTVATEGGISPLTQNTIILNNEENTTNNVNTESVKLTEELMDNGFASIAEKLVEAKLGLDNTQMVDTNKVREALRETQIVEEEPSPEFDEMYRKTFGVEPLKDITSLTNLTPAIFALAAEKVSLAEVETDQKRIFEIFMEDVKPEHGKFVIVIQIGKEKYTKAPKEGFQRKNRLWNGKEIFVIKMKAI